ncbi:hypothetical protein, partial [Corallococcus terminator]|uniref:hypothetical protein n=1 Tax=Corallococcus terminator TaxID=2316733 RepID=UPI001ABFFA9B
MSINVNQIQISSFLDGTRTTNNEQDHTSELSSVSPIATHSAYLPKIQYPALVNSHRAGMLDRGYKRLPD